MSEVCLIVGLLLFGQLGDRYPGADNSSALPVVTPAEVGASPTEVSPTEVSPQVSAATEKSAPQADMFDIQPQDSVEQPLGEGAKSELQATTRATQEITPQITPQPPQTSQANETTTLLESFSAPTTGNQLSGKPITLIEVVASSPTRSDQTQRIEAYWKLSQAVLDYNLALKEKIEINALRRGIAQAGPHWDHALALAETREQLALKAAHVAQQRLADRLGFTRDNQPPLPSDLPFFGAYNTRYTELFPQQTPQIAKDYDEFLTSASQVIKQEAKEIAAARDWMFAVSEQRSPQTDGRELLTAYELFAARRKLFVQLVADYNCEIVRYTEIATPGIVEPQRLVAMLIRFEGSPSSNVDPAVRRTSAEEQVNPADTGQSQPRPTAENSWHALPNNTERSILVPRQ